MPIFSASLYDFDKLINCEFARKTFCLHRSFLKLAVDVPDCLQPIETIAPGIFQSCFPQSGLLNTEPKSLPLQAQRISGNLDRLGLRPTKELGLALVRIGVITARFSSGRSAHAPRSAAKAELVDNGAGLLGLGGQLFDIALHRTAKGFASQSNVLA